MNRYPLWKNLLLSLVVAVACVYALPNVFGDDPVVQISARKGASSALSEVALQQALQEANVSPSRVEQQDGRWILRFEDTQQQLAARDTLSATLGSSQLVALNLLPAGPQWLQSLASPMYLGLDLRGGVHFLMQVDMQAATRQAEQSYLQDLKTWMREQKIRYRGVRLKSDGGVAIQLRSAEQREEVTEQLQRQYRDLVFSQRDVDGKAFLDAVLTEDALAAEQEAALQQNIITLRNRVNELGVAEPVIQRQGTDRIVVQLAGVQDTGRAKEILGATATLEYRMVYGSASDWLNASESGRIPSGAKLFKRRDDQSPILLDRTIIVTGDQIKDASSGIDTQSGTPAVFVSLDGKGAKRMQRISAENIGNPMAVVFIENRVETKQNSDGSIERVKRQVEEVISVATIRDVLSNRFQTTGLGSEEARDLSLLLRAGALKAPVDIIEERTVGPSLGQENIEQGFKSCLVGMALVMLFMGFYYRVFGLVANVALTLNLVMLVAVLSVLQATLTLPGIAGIVLTVGMAVDANVLIFERIREELRNGNTPQNAINAGYEKAFGTIADANVTTLIAAIVLFAFGTGAIKGFAVTLSIGIVTSMFTAIMGTRALVNWIYGGRKTKQLSI